MVDIVKNLVRATVFLIAAALPAVTWAENMLQLRIHEDKIFQDESFLLVVTAQGRFAIDDLDTRPLIENNYVVGNIDSNYNIDRNETYWRIPLLSHTAGSRQIPSMLISNNVTTPLPIVVRNRGRVSNYPELSNLIKSEITSSTDQKHYTNQTLFYTVTITQPRNVEITNITSPTVKGGTIHLIHEENQAPNNRNHNLAISRKIYAVSFHNPGTYEIEQPTITGKYNTAVNNIPHSLNNPVISSATVVLTDPNKKRHGETQQRTKLRFVQQLPDIKLSIEGFEDLKNLIVADEFKIKESWAPKTIKVTANSPITHELEFEAVGASIDNFPKISMKETPQFKVYEDKGYTSETYDPKTGVLKSKQIVRYIYIPLKKMKLHFDPIKINWINANTQKTDLNVFNLKTIDYDVLPEEKEGFDLSSSYGNRLLYLLLVILVILLIMCILYLLYLDNIIKFNYLTDKLYKCRVKRNLLKNFSDTDPRNNYRLIMGYATGCIDRGITCFEMLPQYSEYRSYLDEISYYLWKKKISEDEKYDGSKFRKELRSFVKAGNSPVLTGAAGNKGYFLKKQTGTEDPAD